MKLTDIIRKIDPNDALGLLAGALDLIGRLAGSARTETETAAEALRIIGNIYASVVETATEKIKPEDAQTALDQLEKALDANDAAAQAALEKKFDDENPS